MEPSLNLYGMYVLILLLVQWIAGGVTNSIEHREQSSKTDGAGPHNETLPSGINLSQYLGGFFGSFEGSEIERFSVSLSASKPLTHTGCCPSFSWCFVLQLILATIMGMELVVKPDPAPGLASFARRTLGGSQV